MYSYYETSSDDLITNAEKCKELVLDKLVREGYIKRNRADEFLETWHFVSFKPSLYTRLFKGRFKTKEEQEKQKDSIHMNLFKLGE